MISYTHASLDFNINLECNTESHVQLTIVSHRNHLTYIFNGNIGWTYQCCEKLIKKFCPSKIFFCGTYTCTYTCISRSLNQKLFYSIFMNCFPDVLDEERINKMPCLYAPLCVCTNISGNMENFDNNSSNFSTTKNLHYIYICSRWVCSSISRQFYVLQWSGHPLSLLQLMAVGHDISEHCTRSLSSNMATNMQLSWQIETL